MMSLHIAFIAQMPLQDGAMLPMRCGMPIQISTRVRSAVWPRMLQRGSMAVHWRQVIAWVHASIRLLLWRHASMQGVHSFRLQVWRDACLATTPPPHRGRSVHPARQNCLRCCELASRRGWCRPAKHALAPTVPMAVHAMRALALAARHRQAKRTQRFMCVC